MFTEQQTDALVEPIARALRDGVEYQYVEAGADHPAETPPRAIIHIDDTKDAGPAAFRADALLRRGAVVMLIGRPVPIPCQRVADLAREGIVVLITCGPTFRFWWAHLERLGLTDRTLAFGIGDPTRRMDS